MTIVLPEDDPSIEDRKGIVVFIDSVHSHKRLMNRHKGKDTANHADIEGMELTATIEVDKKAKLGILMDPSTGDMLNVQGDATLSFAINPSGQMTLTGRYEITEGSYQLSFYNFVRRKFIIQQGSTITWLSTPMDADVDITAVYSTRAAPLGLMESAVAGESDEEKNRYKQLVPFNVMLGMKGQLRQPALTLDIQLPDDQKGVLNGTVSSRLMQLEQDPSEMNKQVFSLLVLNRFLPEDPLAKSGGGDNAVRTAVASSVSELLSQQLNTLASKYIKDVQLNFDLNSYNDYSTGTASERTDLKVGLQKNFLNDKLTVQVGGDVNLENQGPTANNSGSTNQIVSDVSVEYQLTKDGRLRLLFFRNNQYAGFIEGQLVETGAGIIFVRDFNNFKQLFKKPREQRSLGTGKPKTESASPPPATTTPPQDMDNTKIPEPTK
jgi:hypothetical protein